MNFNDVTNEIEKKYLSPYAVKSSSTKGRIKPIEPSEVRTEFQRDRDRIIHSKAFRRLKHKTQVFIAPEGDHYRTRLTHTLEVSQIARTISRALRMNEDLTEAISLGHDLGHTPFGHAGERALNECMKSCGGFTHPAQSLRVVDIIEDDGVGMNLTHEVRNGIANHSRTGSPETLEGLIVRFSDQIAYLNHDLDDAVRAGVMSESDLPGRVKKVLGTTHGTRIDSMIKDIIYSSYGKNEIVQSPDFAEATELFRNYMFENIYRKGAACAEEPRVNIVIKSLFDYLMNNRQALPEFLRNLEDTSDEQRCDDYISMMSDRYAVNLFEKLFVPKSWTEV